MNLEEWRKSPERRSLSIDMLNQQTMREMLLVMEVEHPGRKPHKANDGFGATRAIGRIEGYQEALDMLRLFAEPIPVAPESIPVTWNADKTDQQS